MIDDARFTSFLRSISDALEALENVRGRPVEVCTQGLDLCADGFVIATINPHLHVTGGALDCAPVLEPGEGMKAFVAALTKDLDGRVTVDWHEGWPLFSVVVRSATVAPGSGATNPAVAGEDD